MNWIGKRFRTKIRDGEEDEEYGEVTHPIGSTFVVTQQLSHGKDPEFMVAWEQAVNAEGDDVPAKGMWTCWSESELINDAEEIT